MGYCRNCGNKLGEGVKFCTNCGNPVSTVSLQRTAENAGKGETPSPRKFKTYKVGETDYRKLNNVSLVTEPSQHKIVHITAHFIDFLILIYVLIRFLPLLLPVLTGAEGASELMVAPGMFPGLSALILLTVILRIIERKILFDILDKLPRGFDRWEVRRLLKWKIFGLESFKTAVLRLLRGADLNYPELGFGTDDEGNYYAFKVSGEDVDKYPFHAE